MAVNENLRSISLNAPSTVFSTYQYRMVVHSSSDGIFAVGSTATAKVAIGVLQDAPTVTGEAAQIAINGSVTKIQYGAAMDAGDNFAMGALGRAVTTAGATAGDFIYGPVLTTVATSDTIGTVMFNVVGKTT